MRGLEYEITNDLRSIDRSQDRNMPNDCSYCGYRSRPSSSGDFCSECCHIKYDSSKTSKR